MAKVKFGVVGVGNIGTHHIKTIPTMNNAELTAVCDINPAAFERIPEAIRKNIKCYTDSADFFANADIEAVIIAVPHYDHPDLAIQAMEAGKHVIVEKPIAVHKADAERLVRAAEQHPELKISLMFCMRTLGAFKKIKQMIDNGDLGKIRRINWIITTWFRSQLYYDSGDWRATWRGEGGGVLLNQCPHQLDLLQWLFGMPTMVRAFCHEAKWHDIEVEDDVTAYLEFPNGSTGVFIASTGDLPGVNRLEITCDRGRLLCEDGRVRLLRLPVSEREYCRTAQNAYGKPACTEEVFDDGGDNPQHAGVTTAFVRHILHGEPLVARGEEGMHSLRLSNAIHLSGWLGEAVTLPVDEEIFLAELNRRRAVSRLKDTRDITFTTDHSGSGSAT